jgi:DNA (cytosine-5)-methyltransferase 1
MFLASSWNVQKYKVAEVQIGLLAAQIERKPRQGCPKPQIPSKTWLESADRMGVPTKESRQDRRKNRQVSGERTMKAVELFTGAGGLALGIEKAGFHHDTVVERDKDCCQTIRENQRNGYSLLNGWRLFAGNVREFDYSFLKGSIDLLAAGPPCQPFSIGGKHQGPLDRRDMFPEVARAVRELRPRAIMVENVRGLLRESFATYFEYVTLQLRYPEVVSKPAEDWTSHLSRLERHGTRGNDKGLHYNIVFRPLNAANYGVPQKRERVIIVGFRADLGIEWSFPEETHSRDALLSDQWITKEYWDRHRIAKKYRPAVSARLAPRIERLRSERSLPLFSERPWRTVRDALEGLPDPELEDCSGWSNHKQNPGARSYVGHTGSPFDEPAKTLKAGDHGVPGGENALVKDDGAVRYFTVRESARLQSFPDDYVLHGAWSEAMRQLGNAVPVALAERVANGIRLQLSRG